jgi:hypothetical protein
MRNLLPQLAFFIAVTSLGCGSGNLIETIPAKGVLMVNQQPADGATIILVPEKVSELALNERPSAKSNKDGTFALTTIEPQDGAPIGDYKVLVTWPEASEDPEASSGSDRLNFAYSNPATTPLKLNVSPANAESLQINIPPVQ